MLNRFAELVMTDREADSERRADQAAATARQAEVLAQQIAAIPRHPVLKYTHADMALVITLDFTIAHSPFQEAELARSLNQILPRYSQLASCIYINISFKPVRLDTLSNNTNGYRHCLLANTVWALNKFHKIHSIRVAASITKFDWVQFRVIAPIYGLYHKGFAFNITEHGSGTRPVDIGSNLDRRLMSRFTWEMTEQ